MILETLYGYLKPNQAEKVLLYILEHLDASYNFSRSYECIQKDTGVSQPTIARVFKDMEKIGAAKHIAKSKWSFEAMIDGMSNVPENFREFYVENKGP